MCLKPVRLMLAAATIACCAGLAFAQSQPQGTGDTPATPHSTGRTVAPERNGQ